MIPRALHFIWLGDGADDAPSDFFSACRDQTARLHADWRVTEWTSVDVTLNHPAFDAIREDLQACWRRFAGIPTSRSDLMRLMVLYLHGGVYCDHDVWAIRRFDDLLENRDLLLAADRMTPLLIGEHVMGASARNRSVWDVLSRFINSEPSAKTGNYSPRLTKFVIERGWEAMYPTVFCPHGRDAEADELYRVYPHTRAVHCWAKAEYDLDRLRKIA